MSYEELARLKHVSASMGIMLETASDRLREGRPAGSPDKVPAVRLRTIEDAGRLAVPFTTGILVGIGEDERERAEALFEIRDLHRRYRHVQEVIVQNFRSKPGTAMQGSPEPGGRGVPRGRRHRVSCWGLGCTCRRRRTSRIRRSGCGCSTPASTMGRRLTDHSLTT